LEPQIITPQAHIDAQALARVRQLIPDGTPEAAALDKAIAQANAQHPATLVLLEDGTQTFEAAGCKYYVAESFSIERYTIFEEFGLVFGTGSPFMQVFNTLVEAMKMLNSHPVRLGDLSVMINKTLTNIAHIEGRETYAFQVCTLFINRVGENPATWSPEDAKAKIADWKAAGLDARFFLRLAALSVSGFIDAYKSLTPNISAIQAATQEGQPQS
jgi:hypothetical protein